MTAPVVTGARQPATTMTRAPRTSRPPGTGVLVGLAAIAYRRRATALHAARPAIGAAYCAALVVLTLAATHPLLLFAVLVSVLAAGAVTGALPSQRRALVIALPLAFLIFLVNAMVSHYGLTVLFRFGTVPVLGQLDITAEALAAGGVLALRVVVIVLCGVLGAVAVDPDGLLLSARRRWPAAALTAALALRIVPVLARDGARLADARRCRPAGVPGAVGDRGARVLVLRAVTASVLDRAGDLAATLELRGHGLRHRPSRVALPWSRHDRAILASAVAITAIAVLVFATGAGRLIVEPTLALPSGLLPIVLTALIPLVALLPLAFRRGTAT